MSAAVEPRVDWPAGKRAAVAVTFDLDAESVMLAAGLDLDARPSLGTHQRYGPLTGVPRLLRILAERSVRATFFVPGHSADRFPEAVQAILEAGHEVAHHGYLHRNLVGSTEAEEREELERGLEALARHGVVPTGYRAPWWETTDRTLGLLAEYGLAYDSSLFDRDMPYVVETPSGPVAEVPVSWALDDWERYAYWPDVTGSGTIMRPSEVVETWWEEVEAYEAEGGVAVLVMHPFVSGRPARARALGDLLDRIAGRPGIWMATAGEIAAVGGR